MIGYCWMDCFPVFRASPECLCYVFKTIFLHDPLACASEFIKCTIKVASFRKSPRLLSCYCTCIGPAPTFTPTQQGISYKTGWSVITLYGYLGSVHRTLGKRIIFSCFSLKPFVVTPSSEPFWSGVTTYVLCRINKIYPWLSSDTSSYLEVWVLSYRNEWIPITRPYRSPYTFQCMYIQVDSANAVKTDNWKKVGNFGSSVG